MNYLMTFNSTHDAIQAESAVKESGVKARIVGTPETISAACGLSLKFSSEDKTAVEASLADITFTAEADIYAILDQADGRKEYKKL